MALVGLDEHRIVVEGAAAECDATGVERDEPGDRRDEGGLPGAVGAQQRRRPALGQVEVDVEREPGAANDDAGVEGGHVALHQRSRMAASTTIEITTMTRLRAIAVSRSLSRATTTARGIV